MYTAGFLISLTLIFRYQQASENLNDEKIQTKEFPAQKKFSPLAYFDVVCTYLHFDTTDLNFQIPDGITKQQ